MEKSLLLYVIWPIRREESAAKVISTSHECGRLIKSLLVVFVCSIVLDVVFDDFACGFRLVNLAVPGVNGDLSDLSI